MLHRHGSRYPTVDTNVEDFGTKIEKLKGKFNASGDLSFLNDWSYGMGQEIMVPQVRQVKAEVPTLEYLEMFFFCESVLCFYSP